MYYIQRLCIIIVTGLHTLQLVLILYVLQFKQYWNSKGKTNSIILQP